MKIVDAKVVVTSPGRNFVTLQITTDDGVTGLGDATLNGRELAVVSYLRDHVVPLLIGRDPHRIEDAWQYLYRGAYTDFYGEHVLQIEYTDNLPDGFDVVCADPDRAPLTILRDRDLVGPDDAAYAYEQC